LYISAANIYVQALRNIFDSQRAQHYYSSPRLTIRSEKLLLFTRSYDFIVAYSLTMAKPINY